MRKSALAVAFFIVGSVCMLMMGISTRAQSHAQERDAAPASRDELLAAIERLSGLVEKQSRELEGQRAALREQQEKTAALERRLERMLASGVPLATVQPAVASTRVAGPPAVAPLGPQEQQKADDLKLLESQLEAVADSQAQLAQRVGAVETTAAASQRTAEGKFRQLGNFTFSGDVRIRYEPFFGGGTPPSPAPANRHRPRIRARFNANARFSPEWAGGLSLASGDDSDPISTNQTMTAFFTRKAFRIDRAFAEYTPNWAKRAFHNRGEFKVTAGKFGYTWYRTELTLDNDLNPEGVSETLSFNFKNPVFKNITLVGFQLPFNEVSGGPDSFMHGGQIQTQWQLGTRVKFGGYIGFYDWNHADAIRAAQSAATLSGSSNQHAATATQFASKFGVLDVIGRLDFTTWSARWPLMLQFNYASNTRACGNLVNIAGTPPACDPSDRNAYWAEVQLGQNREARDIQFGYTFIRLEREAVLGAFNFSDLRAPTNNLNHRLNVGYQLNRNVQLSWSGLFGRRLVTTAFPAQERILKRLQFDAIYKF